MNSRAAVAKDFVALVADLKFDDAFNPYTDVCPDFDRADAAAIRMECSDMHLHAGDCERGHLG